MVRLKLKLKKTGNSYGLMVPKSLVDSGVLKLENQEYEVEIKDLESSKIDKLEEELRFLKQKLENRDLIPTNAKTGI